MMRRTEKDRAAVDALTTYTLFAADASRSLERIQSRADVARDVEYYKENITSVKSAEDLIGDQRLYNFVMRAYGLEDLSYAKALIRKVLEQGIDDPEALANKLTDTRYSELASDFNFARFGETATIFEKVKTGVVNKYYAQSLEIEAGGQNDGARLAMYFERKAEGIESPYDILADQALLKFVQTAFSLPEQMSFADIEKQADMILEKLDLETLSDPGELDRLVTRFLSLWDINNPDVVQVPPLIAQPLGVQGLSMDLLSSIQNLKRG